MSAKILSVSYDPVLLRTRQGLLEQQGFIVVSAEGFTESIDRCADGPYDLVVIGHSIPHRDKLALVDAVNRKCPAPILALLRIDENPLEGAAASIDPMDTRAFLATVASLMEKTESVH